MTTDLEVNLFQSVYTDKSEARDKELQFCFEHNRKNSFFTRYFTIVGDGRPTFNDLFRMTEQYPNCINILSNSDIYFPQEFERIKEIDWRKKKICLALSRWDLMKTGQLQHFDFPDTSDVWIFLGVMPQLKGADFTMGKPGCDNRINYLIEQAGFEMFNPSKDIRTIHYHLTQVRYYQDIDRIPPPYRLIHSCHIADVI